MGILSVVGTPIGNLGDMTYRAVETLEKADFICAEDTRVTAKLLNYFDIKTPLVSYHEHNAKQVGESILNRIMAGENAAIVTDAGMPCISETVGFAVAMLIPLYICIESAEIISPLNFFAHSTARAVLPDAVGPTITSKEGFCIIHTLPNCLSSSYFVSSIKTGLP